MIRSSDVTHTIEASISYMQGSMPATGVFVRTSIAQLNGATHPLAQLINAVIILLITVLLMGTTLQHPTTHRNTPQHKSTHCNTNSPRGYAPSFVEGCGALLQK